MKNLWLNLLVSIGFGATSAAGLPAAPVGGAAVEPSSEASDEASDEGGDEATDEAAVEQSSEASDEAGDEGGDEATDEAARPWGPVHDALSARCAEMARDLETAHRALLERAKDNPSETARLTPEAARLRPPGYGVLPEIVEDRPPSVVEPLERFFSLERLEREFEGAFRAAAILARRASEQPRLRFLPLVVELERLQEQMRNLEEHLGYHSYWQRAAIDFPEFFAGQNRLVARVRRTESRRRRGLDVEDHATRLQRIVDQFAPFSRTPGLALLQREDGTWVLPLTVTTDIEDEAFLNAFREGVEAAFVESEAARRSRLRVALRWRRVSPGELYPEGAPAHGAPIDTEAHLERFPPDALVLTTGEESTHAWTGRSIILGPGEISRRTLAHEFAHLMGFRDAYLRGYDQAGDARFGVVFVEWSGLRNDLMGNGKGGRVTGEMIEKLIEAYGPR